MTLHDVADNNTLNIGTADHLLRSLDPEATTPGELINWIKRFDLDELNEKIDQLEELTTPLQYAADDTLINELAEQWTGDGGRAFVTRWDQFIEYIGPDETTGRRETLAQQLKAMKDLRDDIKDLSDGCERDIETHLSGFREAYVKAICQEGDSAAVAQMFADAASGAGIGSAAGPTGTAVGTAVGAVIGLIRGFQDAAETRLQNLMGMKFSIADLAASIETEGSTLSLRTDADSGETLDSAPFNPDSDIRKDETLDGEWEVK